MNTGPVEEAGQTARSFLDALKTQPIMLGMIAVILSLIGFLFYGAQRSSTVRQAEFQMVFDAQVQMSKLLAECYPAPPR
jgi:hypothetical protein